MLSKGLRFGVLVVVYDRCGFRLWLYRYDEERESSRKHGGEGATYSRAKWPANEVRLGGDCVDKPG